MKLSRDDRILRHKKFLAANWELLASFAWRNYQEQGRGAVFVREEDFVHATVPQFTTIRLNFVAANSPQLRAAGGWPGDKEAMWVRTYDPDQRVIVMVLREGAGTSGYLAGGPVRPSQAYAKEQAKSN